MAAPSGKISPVIPAYFSEWFFIGSLRQSLLLSTFSTRMEEASE